MTTILAIDTACNACSCALYFEEHIIQEHCDEPRSHSREILSLIDTVLEHSGLTLADVSAIAFTHGPGSFTGIRIASSVVQGLALGLNLPVITVSTLQSVAQRAYRQWGLTEVVATIDARMGEVYLGRYRLNSEKVMEPLVSDAIMDQVSQIALLEGLTPGAIAGSGIALLEPATLGSWQQFPDCEPLACDILPMAQYKYRLKDVTSVDLIELLYLRDNVAQKSR